MRFDDMPKLIFICCLLVINGCSSFSSGPARATIEFRASTNINPDEDQRSSPLVINVLLLADSRQFLREDFIHLFEDPKSRLGTDLIKQIRLKELIPGETRIELFDTTPQVKYIALIAEFSQYQRSKALMLVNVNEDSDKIRVNIDNLKLSSPDEYSQKGTQ